MTLLLARLKLNRPLAVLLAVFCVLAFFYSSIIPIFEGPDEDAHFRYAKYIAEHRAFPVQLFEPGGGAAGHQGWQPPLYYSLAAFVIAPMDTSDHEQQLWRNYAATFLGDPACCGRNVYYHPDSQNFPWTRTTLAVHLARLLSIFFGAITVAATYALAKTILNRAREFRIWILRLGSGLDLEFGIPLAAAAVVAFNPSFLFASALVSNDAPLAAFSALVLLVWVRLLNGQLAPTLKSVALLGVLIGLALLVKTTALGLIPFAMLVLAIVAWRKRDWNLAIVGNAVMLLVIALLSGWWFARNLVLYGDPLAYRLMITSATFPRAGPLTLPELFQISLPWLWQTFWGGPTPGDFAPALLGVLAIASLLALFGLGVFLIQNSKFKNRNSILILGAWLVFILVAQIQFIRTTTGADQGRYLFPAIPAIALFFVLGFDELVVRLSRMLNFEFRMLNLSFIIGSFFALALFVPFAYTLPAYARPALLSESQTQNISHPVNAVFADQLQLLGYDLEQRAVKPGENLRVTLYWRALAPMSESYRVFVHLVGQGDRFAGGADVIPARGAFPTVYWKPGDNYRDVVQVPVSANAQPGKYAIAIGLYPVGKPGERLTVSPSGDDRVVIDAVKVPPRENIAYNPRTRLNASFGDQIDLTGYDSAIDQTTLRLALYWRARTAIDADYSVFVHVLDANGKIVAQADQPPQAGNYPTSFWDRGEQVRDDYALTLPANARVADYRIALGLYRADTGERLSARVGASESDHIELALPGAAP